MPYAIRKCGSKYKVINSKTGKTKGTHSSRSAAQKQLNLLRGLKHGWKPPGRKKKAK